MRHNFRLLLLLCLAVCCALAADAPAPLLKSGHPVDWWFVSLLSKTGIWRVK
jgi:hypothetical protein